MKTKSSMVVLTVADAALFLLGVQWLAGRRQDLEFKRELSRIEAQRDVARRELVRVRALSVYGNGAVSQELLGIRGSLERLVFLLDKSGSMNHGGKWPYVVNMASTFMNYLPIEYCALLLFDSRVEQYPTRGGYLEVAGPEGANNRNSFLNRLGRVRPGGNTNTYAALERAYALNPTAILLASDGFPDVGDNRFNSQMARAVLELCRRHGRSVPVHVLALGNYFDPRLGSFLRGIADTTGGTFIAR